MKACLIAILILLAAQNGWGQETFPPPLPRKTNLVTVTYPVADLVVPIGGLDYPRTGGNEAGNTSTKEEWLIEKITRTVAPNSWTDKGGAGTIQYYALGMALVVKQSPQVQAQVKKLLTTLQNAQSIEVALETRTLTVSSGFYRGIMATAPRPEKEINLTQIQLFMLLEAAQGDARGDVFQAPKLTVFPGQRASVMVEGKIDAKLCAMVAGNLQHVDVDVKAAVGSVKFDKTCRVVDGSTLVLASKQDAATHQLLLVTTRIIIPAEEDEPWIPQARSEKDIPPKVGVVQAGAVGIDRVPPPQAYPAPANQSDQFDDRLFRKAVILDTPPAKVVPKVENPRLAKILQKYDAACAAGDQAKARTLAVRALDIDPACFQKR
jgi:hypothetical protein